MAAFARGLALRLRGLVGRLVDFAGIRFRAVGRFRGRSGFVLERVLVRARRLETNCLRFDRREVRLPCLVLRVRRTTIAPEIAALRRAEGAN
jgi:hypothetical protein